MSEDIKKGKKKLLAVGVPATLNLKAELERARSESKQGSGSNTSASANTKKRATSQSLLQLDRHNRGVHSRAQKDILATEADQPSESQMNARVKQALEEKAKIYDMLTSKRGISAAQLDDERISRILDESSVDFVGMQCDNLQHHWKRKSNRENRSEEMGMDTEDMVEIVDEFGRTRMVPRSRAKEYKGGYESGSGSGSNSESSLSDSGRRAVIDAARRDRGPGHYSLSLDHAEREEQLLALRQLHDETVAGREAVAGSIGEKQRQQLEQRRAQLRASRARAAFNAQQALKTQAKK
ncbi:hypothetical protein LPJ66_010445 [Kickxella alabastrina]|uniref:Uncharacterized protein n=1 Tax=Kickxella alabastrina TaxID=61397 RepID=A0ACC1I8B5_9FUNG|nr:hypothetical protein LPJ66_010445 [Kickxella alabastrina]